MDKRIGIDSQLDTSEGNELKNVSTSRWPVAVASSAVVPPLLHDSIILSGGGIHSKRFSGVQLLLVVTCSSNR